MSRHLFIIYSCYKNLHKANNLYNYVNNKLTGCTVYIAYGSPNTIDSDNLATKCTYRMIDEKYIVLDVEDSYEYLNLKTCTLFKAIGCMPSHSDIQGVFKCDDDVIPNVGHLNKFILGDNMTSIDYAGNRANGGYLSTYHLSKKLSKEFNKPISVPRVPFARGPLYYLSKRSIGIFSAETQHLLIQNFFEDVMVGCNLSNHGIQLTKFPLFSNDINAIKHISHHNEHHVKSVENIIL
jgi:hypothetical protein